MDKYLENLERRIEEIHEELERIYDDPTAASRVIELVDLLERFGKLRDIELKRISEDSSERQKTEVQKQSDAARLKAAKWQMIVSAVSAIGQVGMGVAKLSYDVDTRNKVLEFEETGSVTSLPGKNCLAAPFKN